MHKVAIIIGSNGALGRAVSTKFRDSAWRTILCDVTSKEPEEGASFVQIGRDMQMNMANLDETLHATLSAGERVHAVINVGGGFRMDNAGSPEVFQNLDSMYSSSVESSILASHLAAQYLHPGGLLVLPGAAAALNSTPWALTYGAMKAAVHHMVISLSSKLGGLPEGSRTIGIAPVMLDTPANRSSMPGADYSKWSPTTVVAEKLFQWASGAEHPQSGKVYKIVTSDSKTEFVAI